MAKFTFRGKTYRGVRALSKARAAARAEKSNSSKPARSSNNFSFGAAPPKTLPSRSSWSGPKTRSGIRDLGSSTSSAAKSYISSLPSSAQSSSFKAPKPPKISAAPAVSPKPSTATMAPASPPQSAGSTTEMSAAKAPLFSGAFKHGAARTAVVGGALGLRQAAISLSKGKKTLSAVPAAPKPKAPAVPKKVKTIRKVTGRKKASAKAVTAPKIRTGAVKPPVEPKPTTPSAPKTSAPKAPKVRTGAVKAPSAPKVVSGEVLGGADSKGMAARNKVMEHNYPKSNEAELLKEAQNRPTDMDKPKRVSKEQRIAGSKKSPEVITRKVKKAKPPAKAEAPKPKAPAVPKPEAPKVRTGAVTPPKPEATESITTQKARARDAQVAAQRSKSGQDATREAAKRIADRKPKGPTRVEAATTRTVHKINKVIADAQSGKKPKADIGPTRAKAAKIKAAKVKTVKAKAAKPAAKKPIKQQAAPRAKAPATGAATTKGVDFKLQAGEGGMKGGGYSWNNPADEAFRTRRAAQIEEAIRKQGATVEGKGGAPKKIKGRTAAAALNRTRKAGGVGLGTRTATAPEGSTYGLTRPKSGVLPRSTLTLGNIADSVSKAGKVTSGAVKGVGKSLPAVAAFDVFRIAKEFEKGRKYQERKVNRM